MFGDRAVGSDPGATEADLPQQDLVGDRLLPLDVYEAEPVRDLAADEEIPPQRLLLAERLLLINRLYPEVVGPANVVGAEVHGPVPDVELGRASCRERVGQYV